MIPIEQLPVGIIGLADDGVNSVAAFGETFCQARGVGSDTNRLGAVIEPDEKDAAPWPDRRRAIIAA